MFISNVEVPMTYIFVDLKASSYAVSKTSYLKVSVFLRWWRGKVVLMRVTISGALI